MKTKALLTVFTSLALASPALAQSTAIVMHYTAPDGSTKTLPVTQPGVAMSMADCEAALPEQVPQLMRNFADTRKFPEFEGWVFKGASCEINGEHLLSTVE